MGQPHHGEKHCAMNTSSMTTRTGLKESTQAHGLRQKENQYIYKHMPAAPPIHIAPLRTSQPASPRACYPPTHTASSLLDPPPLPIIRASARHPRDL